MEKKKKKKKKKKKSKVFTSFFFGKKIMEMKIMKILMIAVKLFL